MEKFEMIDSQEVLVWCVEMALEAPKGRGLVCLPYMREVNNVFREIVIYLKDRPALFKFVAKVRKHPYPCIEFVNGFKLLFRDVGNNGEALRGLHVTFAVVGAGVYSQNHEVARAIMPGSEIRVLDTGRVADAGKQCSPQRRGGRKEKK